MKRPFTTGEGVADMLANVERERLDLPYRAPFVEHPSQAELRHLRSEVVYLHGQWTRACNRARSAEARLADLHTFVVLCEFVAAMVLLGWVVMS